jgi:valyl-tRNA synthetase
MLGDVALAVNPDDPRHAGLIGRRAKHPYLNRLMPIIADGSVDPDFGTGLSSEDQFK